MFGLGEESGSCDGSTRFGEKRGYDGGQMISVKVSGMGVRF